MQRIAVVGCGGSGKTYLANRIAALTGAPVTHLDAVYYDAQWNPLPTGTFAALQQEMTAAPTWVIDGNYANTLHLRLRPQTP